MAIESVLAQSYRHWELIIVDDASTDDTLQVISKYSNVTKNIHLLKLPVNRGAAFCRNKAISHAKGEYIAFLDSDDLWAKNKLSTQIRFMQKMQCDVCFTSYLQVDESGNSLNKRINAMPTLSYKKLLLNNYVGNLTGIYNAAVLGKIFCPEIPKRQDWALWLTAVEKSDKPALGIVEDLAFYRVRSDSMSANKVKLLKHNYNLYYKHLGYSAVKSMYYMGLFLWEYFFVRPKYITRAT